MSIPVSDIGSLTDYATALLNVAKDALDETTARAPADYYLDTNAPAFDCCPALVVVVPNLSEETTSPLAPAPEPALRSTLGSVILATYVIFALRCAAMPQKNGAPPTPAEKSAVAAIVQEDMWALWNGVRSAINNGTIFDTCTGVHYDGVKPVATQGGCTGSVMTVRAMIPGILNFVT